MEFMDFWESRIPELRPPNYSCGRQGGLCGKPQQAIWDACGSSSFASWSVLRVREGIDFGFSEDQKYSYEERKRSPDSSGCIPREVHTEAYAIGA